MALFALTALAISAVWWWLGAPVALPPWPAGAGGKLYCVSYAPFRGGQNPLVEGTRVSPGQIDEDLALLAKYTGCVRTYSIENGLDRVPEIARRHGLKVLQGLWLSNEAEKNRRQIATTIALAKAFPDVIAAVIVGNEVLLRGEMSASDLKAIIREVKAQVSMPVTYADVWEFWLRYPDVQSAVDFVTIHILPYWEDFPLPAALAAAHVAAIRSRVAAAIPNKEIFVGEVGWPSAGRMREGARPSPANQARVILETLAVAQRDHFRVNVIEAFDQPWKRALEGAVGGHWGIFDRATRAPKFNFAGSVSDHPHWAAQALAGILLAALVFGSAFVAVRARGLERIGEKWKPVFRPDARQYKSLERDDDSKISHPAPARYLWPRIAALAFFPAVLFGWTVETVAQQSFSVGSWLRTLAFAAVAAAAAVVGAAACAAGRQLPTFSSLLGRTGERRDGFDWALGGALAALMLVAVEAALGLVFDPRYRDIPFAPLGAAVVPFLVVTVSTPRPSGPRSAAEAVAATVLAAAAAYIVFNEGFANWQALWFCGGLAGLALILARARDAPG